MMAALHLAGDGDLEWVLVSLHRSSLFRWSATCDEEASANGKESDWRCKAGQDSRHQCFPAQVLETHQRLQSWYNHSERFWLDRTQACFESPDCRDLEASVGSEPWWLSSLAISSSGSREWRCRTSSRCWHLVSDNGQIWNPKPEQTVTTGKPDSTKWTWT